MDCLFLRNLSYPFLPNRNQIYMRKVKIAVRRPPVMQLFGAISRQLLMAPIMMPFTKKRWMNG